MRASRAPQGARGLKYKRFDYSAADEKSRPARGAWVEILLLLHGLKTRFGRAPQGARGLKFRGLWDGGDK